MRIPRPRYDELLRHAERVFPEECCGFLVGTAAGLARVVPVTNAAERMRRERPEVFTRDAEHGYVMDPKEQLRAMREAESAGQEIRGIYHSHVEVGAYFSAEDEARAAPDGEPLFPDAVYVVVDVRKDGARGARAFAWDARAKCFSEEPIEIVEDVKTWP